MRYPLVILIFFAFSTAFSQSRKFKNSLDTITIEDNLYLKNYGPSEFFGLGELQEEINFLEVDNELLDACLFFTINNLRKKYHRPILEHNMDLYKAASVYTNVNYASSFDNDKQDHLKANKSVKYYTKKESFHAGQIKTIVNTQKLMNLKGVKNFYYDKPSVKNEEDEWGIVKGSIKDRSDTTATKEYLEPLTYQEFCNQLSKQFAIKYRRDLKNRAYSEGSCSVLLDHKTLFRKKIPSVKIIFIFAGKRTELIEEEEISIYPEN